MQLQTSLPSPHGTSLQAFSHADPPAVFDISHCDADSCTDGGSDQFQHSLQHTTLPGRPRGHET